MKKQAITPIFTHLLRGAFFLVLFALAIQVLPSVLGQRTSKEALRAAVLEEAATSDLPSPEGAGNPTAINDAGIMTTPSAQISTPEGGFCASFPFSVVATDPTVSTRPFRDGVVKTCAAPGGPCQAGIAGAFHYQVFQFTNPVAQCVTVTYIASNANFSFVTVFNAPPVLTNLCTNWVTDSGSSGTNGVPIVFSFNATAGTTYYFLVNDVGTLPANGVIEINAPVCFGSNVTICHKGAISLTLQEGSLELRRHIDHGDPVGPCKDVVGRGDR